jgi:hypothetical protein
MKEILNWLFQSWVKDPEPCHDCGKDGFPCIVFRSNEDSELGKMILCETCLNKRKSDGWICKVL